MEEFLKAILPIIMLVLWVLSQVLGGKREQPVPRRPEQGGGGDDGPEEKELREEIEKFLRQAAGEKEEPKPHEEPWEADERQRRREVQAQQQRHEQQRERQLQQEQHDRQREQQRQLDRERERERERERQRQSERQRLKDRETPRQGDRGHARPVAPPAKPSMRSEDIILAEATIGGLGMTQDHLSLGPTSRLSHLESELQQRHAMEHDLVSVDDHVLREFGTSVTATDAASHDRPRSVIADLLRDPDDIRKAIVLSEVLHRPVERW